MVRDFFQIIRATNLLIVAIVQSIIYFCLLDTGLTMLSPGNFAVLSLTTILIAAAGNVINDYYDYRIDRINRPAKWIAGNTWSLKQVLGLYFILILAGILLSLYLAFKLSLVPFLFLYPVAILGLWLYSFALKCMPVAGNLWVSLFCAGVVLVVALPDWLLDNSTVVSYEIWYYTFFAFLATWYREVIKDLEDMEGDRQAECRTFPVRYGLPTGKVVALMPGVLLLIALFAWGYNQLSNIVYVLCILLQGAILASLALIWWSKNNTYFHNASFIVKLVMLAGTLMLLIQ